MQAVFYWGEVGETPKDSCNTISTFLGISWPLATDWNASKLNLQLSQICQKSGATWSSKKNLVRKKNLVSKCADRREPPPVFVGNQIKRGIEYWPLYRLHWLQKKCLHANAPIFLINLLRSCKLISCSSEGDSFYHFKIWLSKRVFKRTIVWEALEKGAYQI